MRRVALLLVLVGCVAGVIYLVAVGARDDQGPDAGTSDRNAPARSALLRGRGTTNEPEPGAPDDSHPGGTCDLTGRVVNHDGRAWLGLVSATWKRFTPAGAAAEGRTVPIDIGPDGGFVLHGLPRGPVRVVAERPGRFRAESPAIRLPRAEPYVFVIPGGPEIAGRVVDGETDDAVAGAVVRSWSPGRRDVRVAVTTDAEGRFVLPLTIWAGEVVAEGYGDGSFQRTGRASEILVRLWKQGGVRGRVLSTTDGTGVAGVTVYAAAPYGGDDVVTTTSRTDGTYELACAPAEALRLVAAGAGWIGADVFVVVDADPRPPTIVSLRPGQTLERDLHVVRGVGATGRVVDARGEPVGGADVHVDLDAYGLERGLPVSPRTVSDDRGRFGFDALPPIPNAVFHARADGYAKVRTEPIALRRTETTVVEIRFPEGARATISVTAEDTGAPIEGATVELTSQPSAGDTWITKGITDAEGRYAVAGIAAGELRLHVRADGYVWRRVKCEMPPSDNEIAVTLPRPAVIEGHVVLPDGIDASQIGGEVRPAEAPGWENHGQSLAIAEDGAFRMEVPPVGTWQVSARVRSGRVDWHGEVTVPAGARAVRLVLEVRFADARPMPELAGELTVHVVGPDGAPVSAAVIAFTQWYPQGSTSTNANTVDGSATFQLQAKTKRLGVGVSQARGRDGVLLGPAVLTQDAPQPGGLTVGVPAAVVLTGRVVDSEGEGVPSVEVRATPVSPPGWDEYHAIHPVATTRSNPEGRFRLAGLGDGRYEIDVVPPPGWLQPERTVYADLQAGSRDVTVRLARGTSVVITVLDAHGAPASGAGIHLHRRAGRRGVEELESEWVVLTDTTGRARLVGLDPLGRYGVTIGAPPQPAFEGTTQVSLENWSPRDETVRLTDSYRIEGVVRDAAGRGLPDVRLWWKHPESGQWTSQRTLSGGRFTIQQASESVIDVRLATREAPEAEREGLPVARIGAEQENVIVIEPGYVLEIRVPGTEGAGVLSTRLQPLGRRSRLRGDEPVVLVGLDLQTEYVFQVGPTDDGRIGFWRGRPPASGRLQVPLVPGQTIEGAVRLPVGEDVWRIRVGIRDQGLSLYGVFLPGPRYVIRGVPDGRWRVELELRLAGRVVSRAASVKAGDRADFDLTSDD